jgi:hypothetical protein
LLPFEDGELLAKSGGLQPVDSTDALWGNVGNQR